uniref:hypothetical protein n=1 Tax=Nonomuraea pusilla TaxID=46177 RepID=UPI0006E41011|nr:hypothetical protein [Nonomuraea pusilla]
MIDEERMRLELTAHPLQRIGAYALSILARCSDPRQVTQEALGKAMDEITEHAVTAALVRDTKREDAFWLKSSLSFFPNSPMFHPSNGKKSDTQIEEAVRRWRTMPKPAEHLEVPCVLCGRQAVKFFGKLDVPLAESHIYRNTTPRGHEGLALCWPCVCSFYALPYGCRLTGGPAIALHSWDERFLANTVSRQVSQNRQNFAMGTPAPGPRAREIVALWALRHYGERVTSGVDLLVFSNNNKGQSLEVHALEQPLAEWLRRTSQMPQRRHAFGALLRAHRVGDQPGIVSLARNAFRSPDRILGTCARYLAARVNDTSQVPDDASALAELCFSFVTEVMNVNEKDLAEIRATASRVATLLMPETSGGKLKQLYATLKEPSRMRSWLQSRAVTWTLNPPKEGGADGPLVTARAFGLLFDPSADNPAWFHRQMLIMAVLEELHRCGWKPQDGEQVAKEVAVEDELHEDDRRYADGEEEA